MVHPQTVAAIDIGTNSILLLIVRRTSSPVPAIVPLVDQAQTVRLGQNLLATGQLSGPAMDRTLAGLRKYCKTLQTFSPAEVICFGTEALRRASNTAGFRQRLSRELDLDLRLLSPAEEACYTFIGALSSLKELSSDNYLVIDIGGGSTEIVYGTAEAIEYQESFAIGAVIAKEQFSLKERIDSADLYRLQNHGKNYWKQLPIVSQSATVLLTGGTATTLAAIAQQLTDYDIAAIDGYRTSTPAIGRLYSQLNQLSVAERAALPGMEPGRADIISSALILLLTLLEHFSINTVQISVRGARYGLLL